jgi:alpha-D-ribose 1-methylphosphonate 5-triphosphate synthase subunit PhnH
MAFHTGAPRADDPATAAFAFIADSAAAPPFETFALGSQEYPDRSTTLVLQVERLSEGEGLILRGPGIAGSRRLAAAPLPADFLARLADNRAQFPRGVDVLLAAADAVAALPRSLHVAGG